MSRWRKLRILVLSCMDAMASVGASRRVVGVLVLLVLLGLVRMGPSHRPIPPETHARGPRAVWERNDPTPPPPAPDTPLLTRMWGNLQGLDRQRHDANFQLIKACSDGDVARIRNLLGQGADPKYRNSYAWGKWETPLMAAAASGNIDAVRLILSQPGVDPHVENKDYETALTYATNPEIRKLLEGRGVHP